MQFLQFDSKSTPFFRFSLQQAAYHIQYQLDDVGPMWSEPSGVIISGIGVLICHARAGGHPVYKVLYYLDSCLRRACPFEGRGMTAIFGWNSPTAHLSNFFFLAT